MIRSYKTLFGVVFIFSLLLCGCVIKYEDVSNEPEYAPLLDTRYSLSTDMLIYGVNLPPGYGKDINVYMIEPMSMKTSGPEIITEDILKAETVLEVKRIERSIASIPLEGKRIIATVKVEPFKKSVEVPIEIDLQYIQSTDYMQLVVE